MTQTEHDALTADWTVILHSEAAAMAVDREVLEALERAAGRLSRQALALRPGAGPCALPSDPSGPPRPDAAAGAASPVHAPDAVAKPSGGRRAAGAGVAGLG